MSAEKRLAVQWDGETVGYILPQWNGQVQFSYAPEWIEKYNQPISLSLPCADEPFDAGKSTAFFDNLLPEGYMYRELCHEARIDGADTYNFLRLYGQDCAGALVIVPEDEAPSSRIPAYRDITDNLEAIMAKHHGAPQSSLIVETKAKVSIAGAQNKLPVVLENGRFFVPEDGSYAPTTAILKPTTDRFPDLHRNELFCMELARKAGLQTPDAQILQIGDYQAYIVMRYDRLQTGSGITRIHQEDFCQALGINRLQKYEENGGPGFSACGKVLLHPLVSEGDTAREDFIKCALFNYAIGNCDAHGKNFSLICTWRHGMSLAPFYDLVSTRVYPELVQKFAMAIGETFHVDKIAEHSWRQFAADLNIRVERLYSLMDEIGASLLPALEPLAEKHEKAYGTAAIYETLIRIVRDGVNQLTPRCC